MTVDNSITNGTANPGATNLDGRDMPLILGESIHVN